MCLPDSREDLLLDIQGNLFPHNGLKLQVHLADIRKDGTVILQIKLPHDGGLRTQIEKVPLPDGEEGLWHCVVSGLIYFVAMCCQQISISHEDCGCLPR